MKATPEDVAKAAPARTGTGYMVRASMKATPEDVAKVDAQLCGRDVVGASMKATPEDVAKFCRWRDDYRMSEPQ